MSLRDLQEAAKNEMQTLFADYRIKGADGNPTGFNFFVGKVPLPTSDDEPEPIPYILVRSVTGVVPESAKDSPQTAKVVFMVATYDDNETYTAENDVLAVIQRIIERFSIDTLLAGKYNRTGDMEWSLADEDTYPYQFAGIEINFTLPSLAREDDYS